MSWDDTCADCRRPIPARGNHRRRVPRLGGKSRIVCRDCAKAIDEQETLQDAAGQPLGSRPARERLEV